eukprot:COSAG05_NODE_2947_length_2475_cov_1.507155_1_plen_161_part_00
MTCAHTSCVRVGNFQSRMIITKCCTVPVLGTIPYHINGGAGRERGEGGVHVLTGGLGGGHVRPSERRDALGTPPLTNSRDCLVLEHKFHHLQKNTHTHTHTHTHRERERERERNQQRARSTEQTVSELRSIYTIYSCSCISRSTMRLGSPHSGQRTMQSG